MAKNKKNQSERQQWNPPAWLNVIYKIWMVVFTLFKIGVGAVSTVALIGVVCAFAFAGVLGEYLESDILPNAHCVLESYELAAPSTVYCVNESGQIQVQQELYASTDWKKADYEDIPQALIDAAIAIEDKRFYEHQGVDWFTTIKAFANMFFGESTVGGSSMTQQLIKNVTQDDSVTVQRKVQEFFRATLVEKNYDKHVIIEEYMNSIYLGQGSRGVKSAAEKYFGKELQTLTIAECASLISITNNPSLFDPYSENVFKYNDQMTDGRERNQMRQRIVLMQMLEYGYITKAEYDAAIDQELVFKNGISDEDKLMTCTNDTCGQKTIVKHDIIDAVRSACGKTSDFVRLFGRNAKRLFAIYVLACSNCFF